jgi:hypothetical protein
MDYSGNNVLCQGVFEEMCDYKCDDGYKPACTASPGAVCDDDCTYDGCTPEVHSCEIVGTTPAFTGGSCMAKSCPTSAIPGVPLPVTNTRVNLADGRPDCLSGEVVVADTSAGQICSTNGFVGGARCSSAPGSAVSLTASDYGDVLYEHPTSNFFRQCTAFDLSGNCVTYGSDGASAKTGLDSAAAFDRDPRTFWMSNLGVINTAHPAWIEFVFVNAQPFATAISFTLVEQQTRFFSRRFAVYASGAAPDANAPTTEAENANLPAGSKWQPMIEEGMAGIDTLRDGTVLHRYGVAGGLDGAGWGSWPGLVDDAGAPIKFLDGGSIHDPVQRRRRQPHEHRAARLEHHTGLRVRRRGRR